MNEVGIELGTDTDLETLQAEYTALFLGPKGHTPPYQSVFQERRLWGDSAADVKRLVGRLGLEISEDFNMPPDHISVELEILEKLLVSDQSDAGELYRRFFEDHILWIDDFLTSIIPKSNLIFYSSSFKFASQFLTSEWKRLTEQSE
ncbi:MAG: molecular chaperone TorD family protein [bacterium]|nr:molecular chaperone TorD family protein [bacterium]